MDICLNSKCHRILSYNEAIENFGLCDRCIERRGYKIIKDGYYKQIKQNKLKAQGEKRFWVKRNG